MKLVRENLEDVLKPKELTDLQQKKWEHYALDIAAQEGDVDAFVKGIDSGLKISRGLFNKLLTDWNYRNHAEKILSSVDHDEAFDPKYKDKMKLEWAVYYDYFNKFKEALKSGSKLTYKILRMIFTNHYNTKLYLEYLRSLNLDEISDPKEIDKIKEVLYAINQEKKNYPRGYKQYRVLKYIQDNVVTQRQELVKLIYELGWGPNSFNPIRDSGYWSANYRSVIGKYYDVVDGGQFVLNREGEVKLSELHDKFKNNIQIRNISPYR